MPKYISSSKNEFLNKSLNNKLRYNFFVQEKAHLLTGVKNPNHRAFIFALYVREYELIKHAFEENSDTDSFNDDDIDNVFIIELKKIIASGQFQESLDGYLKYKIENQCAKEGREPPKFN